MKTSKYLRYILIVSSLIPQLLFAQEDKGLDNATQRQITTTLPFSSSPVTVTVLEKDGNLYLEGDILVNEGSGRGGAAIAGSGYRWTNSTVPYVIASGHPKATDIQSAIDYINTSTNVCMVRRTTESDYLEYVYKAGVCGSSHIGKQGGRQIVNIGDQCGNTRGSAVHETMHALGFYHEQSRDDRDTYVTVNFANIQSPHEHNFEKYNQSWYHWLFPEGQNVGSYDYGSIMHYGGTAFGKPDGSGGRKTTITPKRTGVTIGQRTSMSAGDIRSINTLYARRTGGCPSTSTTVPTTTTSTSPNSSGGMLADEGNGSFGVSDGRINIAYEVELVPQQTGMSCWAAAAAMIVGWNDLVSIDPSEIARGIGYWQQYRNGLAASDTTMFSYWGLQPEPPQCYTVMGFAQMLNANGPLWVAGDLGTTGREPHVRVVAGMQGDGTPEGTILTIHDPWQRGMTTFRTPNNGSTYTVTYKEFVDNQERLANHEINIPGAIYIAHF
jgi:hypothetical protein